MFTNNICNNNGKKYTNIRIITVELYSRSEMIAAGSRYFRVLATVFSPSGAGHIGNGAQYLPCQITCGAICQKYWYVLVPLDLWFHYGYSSGLRGARMRVLGGGSAVVVKDNEEEIQQFEEKELMQKKL